MKTFEVKKSKNKFRMFWISLTPYYRCEYVKIFHFRRNEDSMLWGRQEDDIGMAL